MALARKWGQAGSLTDKTFLPGNVLIRSEAILGLPEYEVSAIEEVAGQVRIAVRFVGRITCPHCGGEKLRKDRRIRRPRHESWGVRRCVLELETRKWFCRVCGRSFWQARFIAMLFAVAV